MTVLWKVKGRIDHEKVGHERVIILLILWFHRKRYRGEFYFMLYISAEKLTVGGIDLEDRRYTKLIERL